MRGKKWTDVSRCLLGKWYLESRTVWPLPLQTAFILIFNILFFNSPFVSMYLWSEINWNEWSTVYSKRSNKAITFWRCALWQCRTRKRMPIKKKADQRRSVLKMYFSSRAKNPQHFIQNCISQNAKCQNESISPVLTHPHTQCQLQGCWCLWKVLTLSSWWLS